MVLPAPPAHAPPAQARWLDRLIVALELSQRGVLALIDNAAPSRLREAYLRLRARDPATDVIVDVRRLAELPLGATAILALEPDISVADLDWLNLNRPVLAERRLNVVLWCERGAAAALSQRAPDFFDWISVRVDCPPAPAAHAVADVKHAICARAAGIAWEGPGLEETLAAVRPGRPIRRVTVASYQSMIDALTSREPGWLYLEGIDTAFHLRRLRWAMAETGRRVIVFRHAIEPTAPGWWTVHAMHAPITEAVHTLVEAGGTGRLAALTGLDPDACMYARFALRRGIETAQLEALLTVESEPRIALQDFTRQSGWTATEVVTADAPQQSLAITRLAIEREASRHERDDDAIVAALRRQPLEAERWVEIGVEAERDGDFEVLIRWMTTALSLLPDEASHTRIASLTLRGQAHQSVGHMASARADFELAHSLARQVGDASMRVLSAASLANVLFGQNEPLRAREYLEAAVSASTELGDRAETATVLEMLAAALMKQDDLAGARLHLERALSIKQRDLGTDHPSIARSLSGLGTILIRQGDVKGARRYLERSLEIDDRWLGQDHWSTAATLRALALVQQINGNLNGARASLERALAIQRLAVGSDEHLDIAGTLTDLARVVVAGGDLDGARALLEHALAIQQKFFGSDGERSEAMTRRLLARIFVAQGDLVGAISQFEQALVTLRKIFGCEDHPDIEKTLRELERLKKLQGELERVD